MGSAAEHEVVKALSASGIQLKPENARMILATVRSQVSPENIDRLNQEDVNNLCLAFIINGNLRGSVSPSLPKDISLFRNGVLSGEYLLQIDGTKNVAANDEVRKSEEQNPTSRGPRMLKVELTDGTTNVVGFEYRYVAELKPPLQGAKIIVSNPLVRNGIFFLTPENTALIGGGRESNKQETSAKALPSAHQ